METDIKIRDDRKLEGERLELYKLFRKKHPKGKEEAQIRMCLEVSEERIQVYRDIFISN